MTARLSTRLQTKLSGRYIRAGQGCQSLERGLALLRAFRAGSTVLTNAELATRSGLPRSTVSRLTHSLVNAGFLAYDHKQQGYRLSAVVLSLALSFRTAHSDLDAVMPLIREVAEGRQINVGLAVLDQTEMVYLDSIRLSRTNIFRGLVSGARIPAALTSLGRAYMSSMPIPDREALIHQLANIHQADWHTLHEEIQQSFKDIAEHGYCSAQWQPGIIAIATCLRERNGERCALNISFRTGRDSVDEAISTYGKLLLELAAAIVSHWETA